MNRKAQETGPLQKMTIVLIVVSLFGLAMFNVIGDFASNYDAQISDESAFTQYQDTFNATYAITEDINSKISDQDTSIIDVIDLMVSAGYSVLKDLILNIPVQ